MSKGVKWNYGEMELWREMELCVFSKGENGPQKEKATGSPLTRGTFLPLSCLGSTHLTQMHSMCRFTGGTKTVPTIPLAPFYVFLGLWCGCSLSTDIHPSTVWYQSHIPAGKIQCKPWLGCRGCVCMEQAGLRGIAVGRHTAEPAVLPECRAGCSCSWKQKQGGVAFAASPKPSPWMWFPSPEAVILCCPWSIRDTTVPQLPVVLITYSLAKLDLLHEYFRSVETACETKSNSLWFSHQYSKYSNLNLGVKANLVKGYRCWEPPCDEKLSQRASL